MKNFTLTTLRWKGLFLKEKRSCNSKENLPFLQASFLMSEKGLCLVMKNKASVADGDVP